MKNIKKINFSIFFFCLITYYVTYLMVGLIPVGGGAGWDGSVYLKYIQNIAEGKGIEGDPYRLSRMLGFLPAIFAAKIGIFENEIIFFQLIVNVTILAFSAVLFYNVAYIISSCKVKSLCLLGIIFFSWPYLVMPIYYPVLSDHLALFFSIISIWVWIKSYQKCQYILIVLSFFVMPGLFILPLILSSMPFISEIKTKNDFNGKYISYFVVLFGILFIGYVVNLFFSVSDVLIINHPPGLVLGQAYLRNYSEAFIVISLFLVALTGAKIIGSSMFWSIFSFQKFTISVFACLLGFFALFCFVGGVQGGGFTGPPLILNMILQSLASPAKPLIAHFLSYGPAFISSLLAVIFVRNFFICHKYFALAVAFLAYLPILILCSESRQWISAFPLAVLLVSAYEKDLKVYLFFLMISFLLCIPAIFMREEINIAFMNNQSLLSDGWQYYFGRQGPWMSQRVYMIGIFFIMGFLVFYMILKLRRNKLTNY